MLLSGLTADFNARSGSVVQPSYRWCRTPAGATVCTEIAGATGASYTLVGANLADDGTQLKVTVSDPNGTAFAVSQLAVSSLPGVVIRDGDFAAADWTAGATLVPPLNGPSFVGSSPATGGHPGAFASRTANTSCMAEWRAFVTRSRSPPRHDGTRSRRTSRTLATARTADNDRLSMWPRSILETDDCERSASRATSSCRSR